jgi:AcrR family transcriptional regulator
MTQAPAPRNPTPLRRTDERVARERRLCAADWLDAGQALLRTRGIAGIKLAALTAHLGVSTGSFYHHFADFEQYLGALAEHYTVDKVMRDLEVATGAGEAGPVERLQRLARRSVQAGTFDLDRAMRIWATMDPRAEVAVRRSEALVLEFIAQAFAELGFGAQEASLRARVLLSANVAPLLHDGGQSRSGFFRGCLELLVRDAPALRRDVAA